MATNCKFCGTILEENETCACEGASSAAQSAQVHPFPQAEDPGEPQPQVLQAVQERLKTMDYKGILREVTDLFLGVLRKPVETAKRAEQLTMSGSFAVLGAQALAFMLMMWAFFAKMASLSYRGEVPFRAVVFSLVIALLEIVWMYGALYLCGLLFRSKIGPRELLSTVAVASPVWTAAFLVCMLFGILFGMAGFGFYLSVALLFFAMVYAAFMLAAAIRSQVSEKVNVLLMVSVAYAAQAVVTVRVFAAIMSSVMQRSMSSLYW